MQPSRLTISHYAPSRCQLITNMTHHHVHHIISAKLHCVPPKCMSIQNFIVNLDLFTCFELIFCFRALVTHQTWTKKMRNDGVTPTSKKSKSSFCTMVHNAGRWCTTQLCTVEVVHNKASTNPFYMQVRISGRFESLQSNKYQLKCNLTFWVIAEPESFISQSSTDLIPIVVI